MCIQEVFAGDFHRLPVNQPYSHDGPSESRGREAAFLAQWSLFCRSPPEFLILFQFGGESSQELCAFAHSMHLTGLLRLNVCSSGGAFTSKFGLPMIVAGDANVWHPHFNLGRSRSVDNMIVPFIDLLISSCGLVLCNPHDRTTHNTGAALDLVCASSSSPVIVCVHDGDNCCSHAPACCPLLGSDHFLCVGTTSFPHPEVMFPEASHFFAIGVPRCCVLSTSCFCGPRRFCCNLQLNNHLERWTGLRFWTDCAQRCCPF